MSDPVTGGWPDKAAIEAVDRLLRDYTRRGGNMPTSHAMLRAAVKASPVAPVIPVAPPCETCGHRSIDAAAQIIHEIQCDTCPHCDGPTDDDRVQAEAVLLAATPRCGMCGGGGRAPDPDREPFDMGPWAACPDCHGTGQERVIPAVIAAFPATGKSHAAAGLPGAIDADSSDFSWKYRGPDVRERHPDWPDNYIAHIKRLVGAGHRYVFVSTHAEVRAALVAEGIAFTLVYPAVELCEEYRVRMEQRGSPDALIVAVIGRMWSEALAECAAQRGCRHIVLEAGQYLSDVIPPVAESPDDGSRGELGRREREEYDRGRGDLEQVLRELRARVETLPRFVAVAQDPKGWTKDRGGESEPMIHEAVRLADLTALLDERISSAAE